MMKFKFFSFFMFARTKGRVHYNIRSIFISTNNKSVMSQIFTLLRKNTSIILHHVLPSKLSLKRFLAAFFILMEESWYLIARKGE